MSRRAQLIAAVPFRGCSLGVTPSRDGILFQVYQQERENLDIIAHEWVKPEQRLLKPQAIRISSKND